MRCLLHHHLSKMNRLVELSAKAWTARDLGAGGGPLRTSGRSAPGLRQSVPGAQIVRDGAEGHLLCSRPRSRLPGGTPSSRRDPRVCLSIGRPPKTPLVDEEPKRGEDSR
jgi:hypothetical protein